MMQSRGTALRLRSGRHGEGAVLAHTAPGAWMLKSIHEEECEVFDVTSVLGGPGIDTGSLLAWSIHYRVVA